MQMATADNLHYVTDNRMISIHLINIHLLRLSLVANGLRTRACRICAGRTL